MSRPYPTSRRSKRRAAWRAPQASTSLRSSSASRKAAARHGLHFRPLEAGTTDKLNAILGVGSLVGNPTDGGYGVLTSADNYINSIDAMQADPNVDIVLVQEQI